MISLEGYLKMQRPVLGKCRFQTCESPSCGKTRSTSKTKECGSDIHDTDLVMVDRTLTDICFEDAVVFDEVGPGFSLRIELYSCCTAEDFPPAAPAPRRMSFFLGGSSGCSSGKRIRAAFESAYGSVWPGGGTARPGHVSPPSALGPKYNLLAQTTMTIEHVRDGFKTHDLTLSATEDSPFWLPLYGNICCRLVAQPLCMTQPAMRGQLKIKLEDADHWGNFYCVLVGQTLLCYRTGEDLESEDEPLLVIPVTKDTRVCTSESDPVHGLQISISMQPERGNATYAASAQNAADLPGWNKALQQHVYNLSQWKRRCDEVMKVEAPPSRNPKTAKQGSLFHEMAINHPDGDPAAGRRLLPFSSPVVFELGRNGREHDECDSFKFL